MAEQDDVERLVAESLDFAEQYRFKDTRETRLARIVRELLGMVSAEECPWAPSCPYSDTPRDQWCPACMNKAFRARLNAIARGEA